jgi:heme-degrading monooxygenase HmoA
MIAGMSSSGLAAGLPEPPYYAVIFSSLRTAGDQGYGEMAERMLELARAQPGYLGVESARGADGLGITVSYWRDEESIARWKRHAEHLVAQARGKRVWYEAYELRVARVERVASKLAREPARS